MALRKFLAYTLIELIVTVAVIGGISTGAYIFVTGTTEASARAKLGQDVKAVNRAIQVYQSAGGRIPGGQTGDAILARLRREAANPRLPGLKGALIDPRMTIRWQGAGEATNNSPRAYWDDSTKEFYIASSGTNPGVKEFYYGDLPTALATQVDQNGNEIDPNLDDRTGLAEFASVDSWVWDYDGGAGAGRVTPDVDPTAGMDIAIGDATVSGDAVPLDPPLFSSTSGTYPLSWYPRDLSLVLPSSIPLGAAEIYYFQSGGQWQRYSATIPLEPGMAVTAKSVSLDPDHFTDSVTANGTYETDRITLTLATTLRSSYSYAELGGTLAPGSPAPIPAPSPTIVLSNADAVPDQWENSSVFQTYWTWDGSDPSFDAPGRISGISDFSNVYPGENIPLLLSDFGASNSQTIRFVALTKQPNAINSSAVGTATVIPLRTNLLPPLITPGDGSLESGDAIMMALNVAGGQTPANARIYYRTDGVDPGNNDGEPAVAASLYTGEFHLAPDTSPTVQVVARVYPPSAYKAWFNTSGTSTMTYYLPYANSNLYGVQGSDKSIYMINPSTGVNSLLDDRAPYNIRSLALDGFRSRIYYIEDSSTSWRVGYLDLITRNHVQLGTVKTGWTYNATAQPQNLAFFNGALYYIHKNTDDLVRISFNANFSAISSIVKVADMRYNSATFSDVGDIAIDDSGLMFFCTAAKNYWRFDMMTMSGIVQLGNCARTFEGMAFFQARLFGTDNNTTKVWRLTPNTGKDLSSVSFNPARDFVDLAAPTASVPVPPSSSMWSIVEQPDGPHLVEFRNYRSPLISTAVDYGAILYETNKSFYSTSGSGIGSLAVTSAGVAYFARNLPTNSIGGGTKARALFKLDVATLNLGDIPVSTFVGDLGPGLATIAGTLDPDDYVTGLTLNPSGQIYGVLREGATNGQSGVDYLFKCSQVATAMTGPNLSLTSCGRLTSAVASSTNSEDLVFSRNGELYVSDTYDGQVLRVNPDNGSILSVVSTEPSSQYRGLAVDHGDFRIIASNVSGPMPNTFVRVDGGASNDDSYLDYNSRWGYSDIRAISFFQTPFLLVNGQLQLYACDGTPTIYGVDFTTGQTVPVTDALYPVRALACDLDRRLVFYLESVASNFRLGSFSVDTFSHRDYGTLQRSDLAYFPSTVPDNLAYYSGCLWYVEPKTDNLIKVQVTDDAIFSQAKASNMTGNNMAFDLIGDLAIKDDGWMYFSTTRTDGQRFSRFRIRTMSSYEVISGPIPPPVLLAEGGEYRENWFDALAFGPPDTTGERILYGTYSSAPAPMRKVTVTSGESVDYKMTTPAVNIIDFSDQHPGDLSFAVTLKPQMAFKNVYPGYTYADVGGTFRLGAVPPPAPAPVPVIELVNPNEFTPAQLSSTYFQVKWTYDASDPRTSGTALTAPPFANGFPGQPVDVGFNRWGIATSIPLRAAAKSLQPSVMVDSPMVAATAVAVKTELRMPVMFERLPIDGVRQLQIVPDVGAGNCPPGTRIYYTIDGSDPGVTTDASGLQNPITGIPYTGIIPVPFETELFVTARVYPPANLPQWFTASPVNFYELFAGSSEGDMDVMTADQAYPFRSGHDTGHSHQYEKVYNVSGINFFDVLDHRLHNIQEDIPAGTKFKLVVANANLSPAGRFVINKTYNDANSSTWTDVTAYDNTVPGSLPIYSLDGVAGTTKLTQAGIYFDLSTAKSGGLLRTEPGHVLQNNPGAYGEWRNGALCIQAVKVNADGTPAYVTNPSFSGGGVQGPGTSGVLWEIDVNWHGPGGPYGGSPGAESYDEDGNWIGATP